MRILRWGVYLSMSVAVIGGIIYLSARGDHASLQHRVFVEKDENLLQLVKETFRGVAQGDGLSIIELGLLLLIATPLTRVLFSLWAFYQERDRMYVVITLLVLMIICISIMTGFGG